MDYNRPTVVDHGDLIDITAATAFTGAEDGAIKIGVGLALIPDHEISLPVGP